MDPSGQPLARPPAPPQPPAPPPQPPAARGVPQISRTLQQQQVQEARTAAAAQQGAASADGNWPVSAYFAEPPPGASADRQSTPMDVWPIHGFTYCIPPLFDQMAHVNEQQQQQQLQTSAPSARSS